MVSRNNIKALITLLNDNDSEVINAVSDHLLNSGTDVIPELEKAWENSMDQKLQERLENIIYHIQFNTTKKKLIHWKNTGANDILKGALQLAQFQFPELDLKKYDEKIDLIINDIWIEINKNLTALEKVKVLNYMIYDIHKFSRNSNNFYSPQNSFINQVIETHKGNPISLAVIYLSVAYKLNLPIYGVNLPKNFILAYIDEFNQYNAKNEINNVAFYINPYNKGAVLGKKEIDYFIEQQKLTKERSYYTPCNNTDIIIRLINNLIISYERLGFNDKILKLNELLNILQ
jgi:regulator of sirC expression with transglutaminase-like and TPR domain